MNPPAREKSSSSSDHGVTPTQGRPHLEEMAEALRQKAEGERVQREAEPLQACDHCDGFAPGTPTEKPHGPVSERFMRHHYGASGYVPLGDTQPAPTPTGLKPCLCGGEKCVGSQELLPGYRCVYLVGLELFLKPTSTLAALEGAQQRIALLEAERDELKAEHQCCLDGDTAWAEKWRAKYEAAEQRIAELETDKEIADETFGWLDRHCGAWRGEIAALKRAEAADARLAKALDLLKRLSKWDMMDVTVDGPYWRREIATLLGEGG